VVSTSFHSQPILSRQYNDVYNQSQVTNVAMVVYDVIRNRNFCVNRNISSGNPL